MNKVLTIIVTFNAMQWAERCFISLTKSTIPLDVFVVDNGSTDGTQDFVKIKFPYFNFIQSRDNLGFGRANNIGLRYALDNGYDYVYLLNQDAWIQPNTIEELIKISVRNPEYGILSPFQMNKDLIHIDKAFAESVCGYKSNPDILNDFFNDTINVVYSASNVMAAHWFMTRQCIEKVGGFSLTFEHYCEDNNYEDRMLYWGLKMGVVPSLRVVHDREFREYSSQKKIYLSYSGILREISKVKHKKTGNFFILLYFCISHVVYYKSFTPIIYTFKVLLHIREIMRNRKLSYTQKRAFL